MADDPDDDAEAAISLVVADSEHARLIARTAHGAFRTLHWLHAPLAGQRASALGRDRPGRSFESVGPLRHAIAPRSDPVAKARAGFIAEVAAALNEAEASGRLGPFVLVAQPEVQQGIARQLGPGALARLRARVPKHLAKVPDPELAAHFPDWPRTG